MELALSKHSNSEPQQLLPCPVLAAPGSRVSFSWGTGSQLHVTEVACPSTGVGGQQPFASSCVWGSLTALERRVAFELMPLYRSLQRNLLTTRGAVQQEAAARAARQEYSDAVLDVLASISSSSLGSPQPPADELHVAYEAALWQLLDFFFLGYEDLDRGGFPEAFAGWMLQHGSLFDADTPGSSALHATALELLQDPRVDSNKAYWPTLHRLVLLGQLDAALSLLAHHPVAKASQDEGMANLARGFEEVYQLLRTVPRLTRQTSSSMATQCAGGLFTDNIVRFDRERAEWEARTVELYFHRNELLEELMDADPAAAAGLANLLQMLCADFHSTHPEQSPACKSMARAAWNWVELLTGMLLWQLRGLPLTQLRSVVEVAVRIHTRPHRTDRDFADYFKQFLVAACQQEVQELVSLASNSSYSSIYFLVHAFELMKGLPEASRLISRRLPSMGCDQAECFMLGYVEVLLGVQSTFLLGAEYLAWCPEYGADVLQDTLDTSPFVLSSQQESLQALALARRHGLTASAYSIARRLAAAAQGSGQLGAALLYALQAQDAQLCSELVAPLIVKIQQQLLKEPGTFQAAQLDLPELTDLEPLLTNLPDTSSSSGSNAAAAAEDASCPSTQQAAQWPQRFPELHFLRAMLQLQQALRQLHSSQQQQQQQQASVDGVSQQQTELLRAAYANLKQPVQELLLGGLAPAALRLPLLVHVSPLLESSLMPFSRTDVMGLLQVMGASSLGMPSVAAAILDGSHGSLPGVSWPAALGDAAGPNAAAVNAARLALCRGLARAHVLETEACSVW